MTDDDYRPIDCSLHDQLEILALRGRPVALRVREPDGSTRELEDTVVDWVARDGVEWVVTGGGEEIRMDRLVTVDGIEFGDAR
jgi:transcriptional antiterminator Rof (Rho-off)